MERWRPVDGRCVCDRRPVLGVVLGPPLGLRERGVDLELREAFFMCAIG